MNDCPLCGDRVCDGHAVEGLCLACQDDEAEAEAQEEIVEQPKKKTLTYAQWSALSEVVSIASALLKGKMETYAERGWNYDMYTRWMQETNVARETLQAIVPVIDWAQPETIVKLEVA
jgi:hypothetical protein